MEFNSGQYNFKKDIITGEEGEAFIRAFQESKGFVYVDNCKSKEYDLRMSYRGKEYTYEIKTDVYKIDTGNLVIEFECRGKASGINVTKADYFTYFFPRLGEIWNIRCKDLRELISSTNPHVFTQAGDQGSGTKLYRLKKVEVERYFKVHRLQGI